MKQMKKKTAMLLSVLMCAVLVLSGCGGSDTSSEEETDSASEDTAQESAGGYVFTYNGVEIAVDADADAVFEALGDPVSSYDEESCAADGTAYIYTYSGFVITTYPDGDANLIGYITLKDDTVSTAEGIDFSMTMSDVTEAYGEDYTEDGSMRTYEKDGMKLNFVSGDDGESIISIEYASSVMG